MTDAGSDAYIVFGRDRVLDLRDMPPAFIASHLLLTFTEDDSYVVDTPFQLLIVATFKRSTDTFCGVLSHLLDDLPIQAASSPERCSRISS
jgi:hypothetical protein